MLYKLRQAVIKLFNDYSSISSETKHKIKYGEGLKILTPKQMIQRIPIALAQIKVGNTSENLLNKSGKSYILRIEQKKLLRKYITILWIQ